MHNVFITHLKLIILPHVEETQCFLPNPNTVAASSKDRWAVKLCSNKILQLLTKGAGKHKLTL